MLPKTHILVGLFSSIVLFVFFPINLFFVLFFFLASFLIDFDHYIYFIIKNKSFNLKKAYFWFKNKSKKLKELSPEKRKNSSTGIYIFHGIEWIILFFFLGLKINLSFLFISAGMFLHLTLDWIEKYCGFRNHPYKVFLIYDLLKHPKLNQI